jgi:hypothetical protein
VLCSSLPSKRKLGEKGGGQNFEGNKKALEFVPTAINTTGDS